MIVYSQNDPQWKNTKIGFDTGPNDTIGNYGCYMAAIANVCSWAGNDLNPSQINDLCKQNGWLVSSDLISNDAAPANLCNNLQYAGKTSWNDATSMNFFADASDPNVAYIICIDANKAPGIQTHFVMVWATLGSSDLEINDSWDGIRKPLSHYGNPSVIIQSATKFIKTTPVPSVPTPSPTPVVIPEPVVVTPPSPPVPYVPPAAPATGTAAEKYTVLTIIMTFATAQDAMASNNAQGTLAPGNYYVYGKDGIAYNLSTDNMKDQTKWINTLDNKAVIPTPDVTPAPLVDDTTWRTVKYFPDGKSRSYVAQRDLHITDYTELDTVGLNIKLNEALPIWGYFTKDGITFLMPILNDQHGQHINEWRYGIPTTSVYTGLPNMKSQTYIDSLKQAEADNRTYRKSVHHETASDKVYYAEQLIARAVKDGVRFLTEVIPLKKLKAMYSQNEKKK